jgi:5-hydroxyisourate hydrolase-like protein (transthyretin family)
MLRHLPVRLGKTAPLCPLPPPDTRWVFGKVIDDETGLGVAGAVIRLYRSAGAGWEQIREMTTGADGTFGFGISPAMSGYRLTESDPVGYTSVSAMLPAGVDGTVASPSIIDFQLPAQVGVGEFVFVDTQIPETVEPTPLPIPTSTPTSDAKWVFGKVVNAETGQGLSGAVIRLYRSAGAGWNQIREMTTGADGAFGFGISPAISRYLLTEQDPAGFASLSAELPAGIDGTVVDVNSIEFELPVGPGVGPFVFTDIREECLFTATPTATPTGVPTLPTNTPTGEPTIEPTDTPTSTPTNTPTVPTNTPTSTLTNTPTNTPTNTLTSTPTNTPTNTLTNTPTNTPTNTLTPTPSVTPQVQQVCIASRPGIDLIYRVDPSEFRGYDGDVASVSTLQLIPSPPAPNGWNLPGFVPGAGWKAADSVWWDAWLAFFSVQPPENSLIGWRRSDGRQEGLDGVTHLMRSTIQLTPPVPGMHVTSVVLEGWSDNKTAWWWDGELVMSQREGFNGAVELYPAHVRPEGGTYLLAIQNSNDYQRIENPQGTSFRVCVTWSNAPLSVSRSTDFQLPMLLR